MIAIQYEQAQYGFDWKSGIASADDLHNGSLLNFWEPTNYLRIMRCPS